MVTKQKTSSPWSLQLGAFLHSVVDASFVTGNCLPQTQSTPGKRAPSNSMHILHLRRPLQRAAVSGCMQLAPIVRTASLSERFAQFRINAGTGNAAVEGCRYASVKSQGAYRIKNKKTLPKKMGAKRTGGRQF